MTATRLGAFAVMASGLTRLVGLVAAGFSSAALAFAGWGLIELMLAWQLYKSGSRALAWFLFFALPIASMFAFTGLGDSSPVPDVLIFAVVAFEWLGCLCLFGALWKTRAA